MRIIAGRYGGRRLEVPKNNDIRPTSDKVRGSIFNALMARLDLNGVHALDICCGTGAMGIEALSRGAASCVFIDKARDSLQLAKANVQVIAPEALTHFLLIDGSHLKARTPDVQAIDLFFCDPPYNKDLITPILTSLAQSGWLAEQAYGVLEVEKSWSSALPDGYEIVNEKTYGDTRVIFVQYNAIK